MESFLNPPALVKLGIVFLFIVTLMYRKLPLGGALFAGAVALGLWSRMPVFDLARTLVLSLVSSRTLILCLVVSLILVMSHFMEQTGQMQRLLFAYKGISRSPRLNLTLFPALIGLLPMPGGAIFSAPMVAAIGKDRHLSAEAKTLVNYWFRHIWEFFWPLYPGVILTCALSGISYQTFVLMQLPMTLYAIWIGNLVVLRPLSRGNANPRSGPRAPLSPFLKELVPIGIVVGGFAILSAGFTFCSGGCTPLAHMPKEVWLVVSLLLSIAWVWRQNRVGREKARAILSSRALVSMIFLILGIMAFQGVLQESRAVAEISRSLTSHRIPITWVVICLPFLVGAITGITVAYVGTTFPILFSILTAAGLSEQLVAYTFVAFLSGYAGVLMSPLHACLVLTQGYFHADLARVYRRLWIMCAALVLPGAIGFLVLLRIGG